MESQLPLFFAFPQEKLSQCAASGSALSNPMQRRDELERWLRLDDTSREAVAFRLGVIKGMHELTQEQLGQIMGMRQSAVQKTLSGKAYPGVEAVNLLRKHAGYDHNFIYRGVVESLSATVVLALIDAMPTGATSSDPSRVRPQA